MIRPVPIDTKAIGDPKHKYRDGMWQAVEGGPWLVLLDEEGAPRPLKSKTDEFYVSQAVAQVYPADRLETIPAEVGGVYLIRLPGGHTAI